MATVTFDMTKFPAKNPPRFCRACGKALMDERMTHTRGYDAFTGQQMPDLVTLVRVCPDALPRGIALMNDPREHDRWELTDAWHHVPAD